MCSVQTDGTILSSRIKLLIMGNENDFLVSTISSDGTLDPAFGYRRGCDYRPLDFNNDDDQVFGYSRFKAMEKFS